MQKHIDNILFGLTFGIGFAVSKAVLEFIVSLLSHGAR